MSGSRAAGPGQRKRRRAISGCLLRRDHGSVCREPPPSAPRPLLASCLLLRAPLSRPLHLPECRLSSFHRDALRSFAAARAPSVHKRRRPSVSARTESGRFSPSNRWASPIPGAVRHRLELREPSQWHDAGVGCGPRFRLLARCFGCSPGE